ncbi:MAG TPA: hypothetical protein VG889_16280 [Rhizomicrobium sp.]|nr:hypothetical protein [Rhizomicrobium sp.]
MTRRLTMLTISLLLAACTTRPVDRVALPPAPPPGEPGDVVGLSSSALKVAFGTPQFARKDGDTEMWRYDGAGCRAFFFLYPDKSVLVVRHVETMPRPASAAFDVNCLTALRRAPSPVS